MNTFHCILAGVLKRFGREWKREPMERRLNLVLEVPGANDQGCRTCR